MSDRLEEARSELLDVETALSEAEEFDGAASPEASKLAERRAELVAEILELERAARVEAGADPEPEVVDADPADFRPAPQELVVPPLPPGSELEHATMVVLDKHDEDQVLSALEDRMDKVLLYDFTKAGSRIVDLSWQGVMECIRQLNATGHARLRIVPESLSVEVETIDAGDGNGPEPYYVATVAATDEVTGYTTIGTSTEPRRMKSKGKRVDDVFARTKAINKAQRNALKMHIPERLRQAIIALGKGDERRVLEVKHGAGAVAAAQLPPPVATAAAQALEQRARGLWIEIKKLPGWRDLMLPGVFNAKLSRARSSEAELESFVEALESMREKLAEGAGS